MTIVNPLPYNIQNGQAVDAVPVMANLNQIVNNVNANAAPVSGSAAQTFAVANATATNQAVNWAQAGTQVFGPATSSTITPVAFNTLVFTGFSAAGTITVNPGSFTGQRVRVYGCGYTVTVQTNVTSGFPFLAFSDGSSSYTWNIYSSIQNIEMVWDGANWRCTTTGQIVAAPASASNQVVTLGQFLGPITNSNLIGALATNTTYTCSASFTAPSAGYVWGQSRLILGSISASNITNSLLINGTQYQADSNELPQTHGGVSQVSQGQSVTVTAQAVTGSSSPAAAASLYVDAIFIPALQN